MSTTIMNAKDLFNALQKLQKEGTKLEDLPVIISYPCGEDHLDSDVFTARKVDKRYGNDKIDCAQYLLLK